MTQADRAVSIAEELVREECWPRPGLHAVFIGTGLAQYQLVDPDKDKARAIAQAIRDAIQEGIRRALTLPVLTPDEYKRRHNNGPLSAPITRADGKPA